MIIWINGAFGSGKTQTAYELHRRIPNSYVYDPENIGYFIRKNIPEQTSRGDFQNYTMWREFNYSMLKYISSEYTGIIIVPMTIVNPQFFNEIIGRLRNDGVPVQHFTLCASKEVLLARLRSRGDGKNSWAAQQIDRCISALPAELFGIHLNTENLSVQNTAEQIASFCGITLLADTRGKLQKAYDRIKTQIGHFRFT